MLELGNCESRISLMYSDCQNDDNGSGGQNTSIEKVEVLGSITSAFHAPLEITKKFISGLLRDNSSYGNQFNTVSENPAAVVSTLAKKSKNTLKRCEPVGEFLTR